MRPTLFFLLTTAALAHDLYLRPREFRVTPGQNAVVEFHNGDSFPISQGPPVLARVRNPHVVTPSGSQPLVRLRVAGKTAIADYKAPTGAFLIVASTAPNFIQLAPAKFESYLEHENLQPIIEWRKKNGESAKPGREFYSKHVKTIVHSTGPDEFVTRPVGEVIEFIPLADPATRKPGQSLPVQVLFRGAPAANLPIEASSSSNGAVKHRPLGRTDSAGRIEIPLDVPGFWKLHTILMERRKDTKQAEWESFWASLTFEVTP